jgi:hypothetical protein
MFVADPNSMTAWVDAQNSERLTYAMGSLMYKRVDGVFIYSSNAR